MEEFLFLAGGLFLGCLHALEADHIVTVSNLALNKGSLKKSMHLAIQWALGHSLTLIILALLVFSLDSAFVALMSSCLLYTSPSPRDGLLSRMPSSA